jgi:hypothetical protein
MQIRGPGSPTFAIPIGLCPSDVRLLQQLCPVAPRLSPAAAAPLVLGTVLDVGRANACILGGSLSGNHLLSGIPAALPSFQPGSRPRRKKKYATRPFSTTASHSIPHTLSACIMNIYVVVRTQSPSWIPIGPLRLMCRFVLGLLQPPPSRWSSFTLCGIHVAYRPSLFPTSAAVS